MKWFEAMIFGIVQGITEFFPVSSSGHLAVLKILFQFEIKKGYLLFDVILHLATLIAIFIVYRQDIFNLTKAFIFWKKEDVKERQVGCLLLLATVPGALAGFFLEDYVESIGFNRYFLSILFAVTTIFLLTSLFLKNEKYELKSINWYQAMLIGLAQAFAVFPGISRSGITIITGLILGVKREDAGRFSFLLSIPIIMGAVFFKLKDIDSLLRNIGLINVILGFVSSLAAGLLALVFLLKLLHKRKLGYFAFYLIILIIFLLCFR